MSFHQARRGMIWFRNENARNPSLFHRASLTVSQLEHLQAPATARQERRLRKALALTTAEIEQVRENGGKYMPSTHRLGLVSKRR
ncbi:MAG: hypothetical protein EOO27_32425 [Comamonadaceae bacterium]|nr:MAG: hypothetical protein EOO27_32425 [Comamonadaceae bacterium]